MVATFLHRSIITNALGLGIVMVLLNRVIVQASPDTNDPKSVIVFLTASSRTHGLVDRYLDEETRSLLEHVVRHPADYINAVTESLRLPKAADKHSWESEGRRLENTLYLVYLIGPQHGGHAARDFFDRVTSELAIRSPDDLTGDTPEKPEPIRPPTIILLNLYKGSLRLLTEFNDPYAVNRCVNTVEQKHEYRRGTWVVMLRYLEQVAPLRPDIKPKLEKMYDDPASSLHNNPQLLRVLEAIDRAEAGEIDSKKERKAPGNP